MSSEAGDKKHPASDQRRRKAREEGNVVRSQDLASAALLLAALMVLRWRGPVLAEALAALITDGLSSAAPGAMNTQQATHTLVRSAQACAAASVPILVAMFIAAILCNVLQTGPILATAKLMPNFNHINPLSGLKRMFALPSLMRLAFGLLKVAIVSAVAYVALRQWRDVILSMSELSVVELGPLLFKACVDTGLWIAGALVVLAILEYAFQWWKFEQDLMMTDQEVRDELKESQGDPQMVARRRQVQRQLANSRLAGDVPKADAVVTNPTELAIAIRYDPETMPAPIVVAKGAGVVAQRIRRIALEHEIPIVERKPLAQILYKTVDVGGAIPVEQYKAVAEVLRYVYQLKGRPMPQAAA